MNVAPQRGSRVGATAVGIVADLGYTLEVRRSGAGASLACASLDFIARPDDRVRRRRPTQQSARSTTKEGPERRCDWLRCSCANDEALCVVV